MMAGVALANTIKEFKRTRWWFPLVRRYQAHLKACKALDCQQLIEPFSRFVSEILAAPESVRDDMLAITELAIIEPAVRYRQYDSPIYSELKT